MRNHAHLLLQRHVWTVVIGAAGIAAAALGFSKESQSGKAGYGYEVMEGTRCLVDEGSGTFVNRADGAPECVQLSPSPASHSTNRTSLPGTQAMPSPDVLSRNGAPTNVRIGWARPFTEVQTYDSAFTGITCRVRMCERDR